MYLCVLDWITSLICWLLKSQKSYNVQSSRILSAECVRSLEEHKEKTGNKLLCLSYSLTNGTGVVRSACVFHLNATTLICSWARSRKGLLPLNPSCRQEALVLISNKPSQKRLVYPWQIFEAGKSETSKLGKAPAYQRKLGDRMRFCSSTSVSFSVQ